ncbi:Multimeric flavodoxin WrbA [Natronincola peptidivorans]|uniref:Multimeric flavodoxin WrbA n=1 Tax=Natronincola peptidivorans TaxID=426128 RepID=A0A1H9Y4U6_9FIRM|nr:flavodoxin family protein [Natronincola peptidivorans]SES63892.1 Multimeric flavodoxin WrbA [Natronincola peptidivorans]
MKKVTAFIGSQRKKATYQAVQEMEKNLKQYEAMDFEYVFLNDYELQFCRGCKTCFDKGEKFCPLKDDRDMLLEKMEEANGIIFATPNYAFQVSARMKNFFDRFSYMLHRPKFFSKTYTAIVTQGVFGGKDIVKYLEFTGIHLGFDVIKGSCVPVLEPMNDLQQKKLKQEMKKLSDRFYRGLSHSTLSVPSFSRLMVFRMTRASLQSIGEESYDYSYYKDQGWFESDYYYETRLGPIKKSVGIFFDFLGRQLVKHITVKKTF